MKRLAVFEQYKVRNIDDVVKWADAGIHQSSFESKAVTVQFLHF